MKRLLLSILIGLSIYGYSANEKIVENPPFNVWSYKTIEIKKIVLSDTATVLYIKAFYNPNMWIRIASDSYIRANGEKKMLKRSEGIALDTECFMDSTGQKDFTLFFPPIDKNTKQIDFIESDCSNCFKIWGIELDSKTLTNPVIVPEEIKKAAIIDMKDSPKLESPTFKADNAVLKGQFLGYVPDLNYKLTVYVNNPITGNQEENNAKVEKDGSFELKVPMVCDMQVLLRTDFYNQYILLSPGKESSVYFDMQQKCRQESKLRTDKSEATEFMYFGGAWANINNQLSRNDILSFSRNYDKQLSDIAGMNAEQYKNYIIKKQEANFDELENKGLSPKALSLSKLFCQYETLQNLMFASHYLESAFRKANNLKYEDELTNYNRPVIDENFYSFLKDFPINDPVSLYSENYGNMINSCSYLENNSKKISLYYLSSDIINELIKNEQLTDEEKEVAEYLIKEDYNNWDEKRVASLKKASFAFCDSLQATGKLREKDLEELNKFRKMVSSENSKTLDIIEARIELISFQLKDNADLPKEILTPFATDNHPVDTLLLKKGNDFNEKYKSQIAEIRWKGRNKTFANIIGTNKGIAFDLMYSKQKCRGLESYEPISEADLKYLQKMGNPFFATYISGKNQKLLDKIEANKGKGGYSVNEAPATPNDSLFAEMLKPFAGKVILVDFWATWCGPCRMAMKQMEPAKQKFAGKDVVFVYLTDESSPLGTWQNMIPDIHGEHFRLTNDQFNYLKSKFGVRGVPSYLLLSKTGEQVYFQVGFEGEYKISQLIDTELAKK